MCELKECAQNKHHTLFIRLVHRIGITHGRLLLEFRECDVQIGYAPCGKLEENMESRRAMCWTSRNKTLPQL